jgi:hypothetical protein
MSLTVREYIEKFFEVSPSKIKRCIHSWNLNKKVFAEWNEDTITFTAYGNRRTIDAETSGLDEDDEFILAEQFETTTHTPIKRDLTQNSSFEIDDEDTSDDDDDDEVFEVGNSQLRNTIKDVLIDAINYLGDNLEIGYKPKTKGQAQSQVRRSPRLNSNKKPKLF